MRKILIVEDESMVALDLKLILTKAGYTVCGIAHSVANAMTIIATEKPDMVLLDIFLKGALTGIDLAKTLTTQNIPFVYLSANFQESILEKVKTTQPYGFLIKPFREKELLVTLDVAFYRHWHSLESQLRQENELKEIIDKTLQAPLKWEEKLLKIAHGLQPHIPFHYLSIAVETSGGFSSYVISFFRVSFDEYQIIGMSEFLNITHLSAAEFKRLQQTAPILSKAGFFNQGDLEVVLKNESLKSIISETFNLKSVLLFPLLMPAGNTVHCTFYSRKSDGYSKYHLSLLNSLQQQLVRAMEVITLQEHLSKPLNSTEFVHGDQTVGTEKTTSFPEMIGKSHQLLAIQDMVMAVAPLDTSVLILGETGTGKELIARSLHSSSQRQKKPFIKVNCATLPAQLIESELFGHERGSFTGAFEKRVGKFEQAEGGSIFLDEIGELAFDLQAKLLRVLQEKEFERIGSNKTLKCDVRVITATNRKLEKEIEQGRFRADLFYRLSIFPILLPPLRERKEDIGLLSNYFARRFCLKMNRPFYGIHKGMMEALFDYHWPGNIRELENVVERAVILTENNQPLTLSKPLGNADTWSDTADPTEKQLTALTKSDLENNEMQAINDALQQTKGRIRGTSGAAALLGIKPTTLESKMKKYNISKHLFDRLGS